MQPTPPVKTTNTFTQSKVYGFFLQTVHYFAYFILKLFFKVYLNYKITGLENLPSNSSFIIAPNQRSHLDSLLVFTAIPLKYSIRLYFVVRSQFANKFYVRLAGGNRLIPINHIFQMETAIEKATKALRENHSLLIFPEGDWDDDPKVTLRFRNGVGAVSVFGNSPVIPAYIHNSHLALPEGKRIPRRAKVAIGFGRPIYPEDYKKEENKKKSNIYEKIALATREEMMSLKKSFTEELFP